MKSIVFCGFLVVLLANLGDGAILQRRLRDGNNINRKLKSCNVVCAVKQTFRGQNGSPQKCYQLQKPNITVSECVYNCLRFKRGKSAQNLYSIIGNESCISGLPYCNFDAICVTLLILKLVVGIQLPKVQN